MASASPGTAQTIYMRHVDNGATQKSTLMIVLPKDQKPFQCGLCSVSFSVNPELVIHVKAHYLTKPFQCGYCKVSYESNTELLKHMKTHNLFLYLPSNSHSSLNPDHSVDKHKQSKVNNRRSTVTADGSQILESREAEKIETFNLKAETQTNECEKTSANASLSNSVVKRTEDKHVHNDDNEQFANDGTDGHSEGGAQECELDPEAAASPLQLKEEIVSENPSSETPYQVTVKQEEEVCEPEEDSSPVTIFSDRFNRPASSPVTICSDRFNHPASSPVTVCSDRFNHPASSPVTVCSDRFNHPAASSDHKIESVELLSTSQQREVARLLKNSRKQQGLTEQACSNNQRDVPIMFKCGDCDAEFQSPASLWHHWTSLHQACSVCKESFPNPDSLQHHLTAVHERHGDRVLYRPFVCGECGAGYRKIKSVSAHIRRTHKEGNNVADPLSDDDDCADSAPSSTRARLSTKSKVHTCPVCSQPFTRQRQLVAHIHSSHKSHRQFPCPACDQSFKWLHNLKRHHATCHMHVDLRPYQCQECDQKFKLQHHLKTHYEACHIEGSMRPHQCSSCGLSFKLPHHLKRHTQSCQTLLRLKQGFGTEGRETTGDLNQDGPLPRVRKRKRQEKEKAKIICHICGKDVYCLRTHIASQHSDVKPHRCTLCDKAFKSKYVLTIHEKTHTNEKPYMCEVCGKSFAQKNTLKYHKNTHTNARPYQCEICHEGFNAHSGLMMHRRRQHTRDKRYTCDVCGMRFIASSNLRRHALTHTDLRPLSCKKCGKTYRSRSSLQYHMVHSHSMN